MSEGCTLWFTGLSASGKTTISEALAKYITEHNGRKCYCLDGDIVRYGLCKDLGFSGEDRRENIRRVSEVSAMMASAGIITLCSFISPYREDRAECKRLHYGKNIDFFEIFVDTPLKICAERDPKMLYAMAHEGKIKNFTGVSAPYEEPIMPNLVLKTDHESINECIYKCMIMLEKNGIL